MRRGPRNRGSVALHEKRPRVPAELGPAVPRALVRRAPALLSARRLDRGGARFVLRRARHRRAAQGAFSSASDRTSPRDPRRSSIAPGSHSRRRSSARSCARRGSSPIPASRIFPESDLDGGKGDRAREYIAATPFTDRSVLDATETRPRSTTRRSTGTRRSPRSCARLGPRRRHASASSASRSVVSSQPLDGRGVFLLLQRSDRAVNLECSL